MANALGKGDEGGSAVEKQGNGETASETASERKKRKEEKAFKKALKAAKKGMEDALGRDDSEVGSAVETGNGKASKFHTIGEADFYGPTGDANARSKASKNIASETGISRAKTKKRCAEPTSTSASAAPTTASGSRKRVRRETNPTHDLARKTYSKGEKRGPTDDELKAICRDEEAMNVYLSSKWIDIAELQRLEKAGSE
jgi:hypothetical protein